MQLCDSRRLTGRNLIQDRPGAVIEVQLAAAEADEVIAGWRHQARRILDAVGWEGEEVRLRRHRSGATLALSAPIDALYSATEVNEWALEAATAAVGGRPGPDLAAGAARLREAIQRESQPALLELRDAAAAHGVAFLADDDLVTLGLGCGSRTWPRRTLLAPGEVDWPALHDVPTVLVTGTNGKTTTVRLVAAMLAAAGRVAGMTTTDGIAVGDELLESGDYSGPAGARQLLRDRRVEAAVLETARGGILRRGIAIAGAAGAAVTNVAADHLGELGIDDLADLAETKLVVIGALAPGGRAVLNASDPELARRGAALAARGTAVTWFSLRPPLGSAKAAPFPDLDWHLRRGGEAVLLDGDRLVLARGGRREAIAGLDEVPIAFGGAARYNVANALAAIGLGAALGLPAAAMAAGLRSVQRDARDNPGRGALFVLRGRRILVDYAHNPHGLRALLELATSLPAARRLLLIGQAGDRSDEAIRDLARTAWSWRAERVIVKELPTMLRGRLPGEVPALLAGELRRLGAPAESIGHAPSELDAVRQALVWAQPGDLLLLLVHTQRAEVLELLSTAGAALEVRTAAQRGDDQAQ
ncbi:MAG TPA: Mur ligase family protein [Thermoanaerobaculia bacterium]|nr:Mur ligase family protein [Thermoanaerobaculia bacterium]